MCSRIIIASLLLVSQLGVSRSLADQNVSLSQLILAMADETAKENLEAAQPGDDESTDAWLGGKEDDAESADDEEALESRSRETTTADFLSRLHKPIGDIRVTSFNDEGRVPNDRAADILFAGDTPPIRVGATGASVPRPMRYTVGSWHRPLYYQQPNLERCGNSIGCLQNALSGIQFITNTFTLPYHMTQQRPDCPVSTGVDCQTCQEIPVDIHPLPIDQHALLIELAAIGGFAFLLL